MIPIIEGQSKNLNLIVRHFAELIEGQNFFLSHQFCTFRFSVPSLNLKTDRNLEIAPKPAPLQKNNADHFAELKENQKPQPGGPDFNLSNC